MSSANIGDFAAQPGKKIRIERLGEFRVLHEFTLATAQFRLLPVRHRSDVIAMLVQPVHELRFLFRRQFENSLFDFNKRAHLRKVPEVLQGVNSQVWATRKT